MIFAYNILMLIVWFFFNILETSRGFESSSEGTEPVHVLLVPPDPTGTLDTA